MADHRNTDPTTREPRFEDLETDEARTTSEEAMAPNAIAAAQGGSASPTSGGPAAIVPAAPGDVLNVGGDRTSDPENDANDPASGSNRSDAG